MEMEWLPAGAVKIEYLQSTGTQRIDTGIYPKTGYSFTIKYSGYTVPSTNVENVLFAAGTGWSSCVAINNSKSGSRSNTIPYINYDGASCSLAQQTEAELTLDDTGLFLNRSLVYSRAASSYDYSSNQGDMTYQISILRAYTPWYGSTGVSLRLKGFNVKNNNVLILDLIPVRVGTTGYLYDRVSKQLFGNSGTGNFVLGPDK